MEKRSKKLLDQIRDIIRLKQYSIRTEQAYVSWIKMFLVKCENGLELSKS